MQEHDSTILQENHALVLDMIAQICTMSNIPETFGGLAQLFVESIPVGYNRVDIVADTYRQSSIKTLERKKRGDSAKLLIKSLQSKIPPDFSQFLLNGENKSRMIELISEYVETNKAEVLNILRCNKIVISLDCKCVAITHASTTIETSLVSNQEEADTKVILHCYHILNESTNSIVTLRSPSGDTDIIVLAISLLKDFGDRVLLDNGSGKHRKVIKL